MKCSFWATASKCDAPPSVMHTDFEFLLPRDIKRLQRLNFQVILFAWIGSRLLQFSGWDRNAERLPNFLKFIMSPYQILWETIRDSSTPVVVRCPKRNQKRLIQAVRKKKTAENTGRKSVGLPAYGKLITEAKGDSVEFQLEYNWKFI